MFAASRRFYLTGIFCTVIATIAVIVPDQSQRLQLFRENGFFFIFLTTMVWVSSWPFPRLSRYRISVLLRGNLLPMLLALFLVVTAFLVSPPQFRVLADETNLAGISMNMFFRRQITNPIETLPFTMNMHDTVTEVVDKRPLLFPLLAFFIHSLLGYRPENAFLLNAIASFLLLMQFYLLLTRWWSRFWSGVGMTLLAAYPVVVLSMTSGGFEILNLLLIITCFRSSERLIRLRRASQADFLLWTLVLLAHCRYESAIYLPLLAPFALWVLYKSSPQDRPIRTAFLPLSFVPIFWQRLSFLSDSIFDIPPGKTAFSFEWLKPNLVAATSFFLGEKSSYGVIPFLTLGAMVGLLLLAMTFVQNRHRLSESSVFMTASAAIAVFVQSVILYFYYWGNLNHRYSFRLAIVFIPIIIVLNLLWLSRIRFHSRQHTYFACMLCLFCLLYYRPIAGMNVASQGMLIYREHQQVLTFLKSHFPHKDILLISHRPSLFIPFRWGAVSYEYASRHPELLQQRQRLGSFREIIAHQCVRLRDGLIVDPDTDSPVPESIFALASAPHTKLLAESLLSEEYALRIVRVLPP